MTNEINSQERMMAAAILLFSRSGYHGTTAKEVSQSRTKLPEFSNK